MAVIIFFYKRGTFKCNLDIQNDTSLNESFYDVGVVRKGVVCAHKQLKCSLHAWRCVPVPDNFKQKNLSDTKTIDFGCASVSVCSCPFDNSSKEEFILPINQTLIQLGNVPSTPKQTFNLHYLVKRVLISFFLFSFYFDLVFRIEHCRTTISSLSKVLVCCFVMTLFTLKLI